MLRHCLLDKGFKRCRYRPHLTTRSTMFLNNFVSLSTEEFFQVAIVKVTQVFVDFFLFLAFKGREHCTANPAFILRQTELVGSSPAKNAQKRALAQETLSNQMAHQNDWRITGYAGTVEVERGNFNRLRLTRIAHRVSILLVSIAPFVIRNIMSNLLTIHHARTDKKRDSMGIEASAKTHF